MGDSKFYTSKEGGAIIMFWQSAISGGFAGLMVSSLVAAVGYLTTDFWRAMLYGFVSFIITFAITSTLVWFYLLVDLRALIWNIEGVVHMDLDGDEQVGVPDAWPETVRVEVKSNEGRTLEIGHLPVSSGAMVAFSKGILNGRDFTSREWTREPNKLFSQPQYDKLVNYMLSRKWAAYKNEAHPTNGLVFTTAGRALIQKFAEGGTDAVSLYTRG